MDVKTIFDNGTALGTLIVIFLFIDRRVWKWFTKEYWPVRQHQADLMAQTLQAIRESLVSMQTGQTLMTQQNSELNTSIATMRQEGVEVRGSVEQVGESLLVIGTRLDRLERRFDDVIDNVQRTAKRETKIITDRLPPYPDHAPPPETTSL